MSPLAVRLSGLSVAWAAYGALHSLLAAAPVKRWICGKVPRLAPAYRLGYNLVALLALAPLAHTLWVDPGPWVWRPEGGIRWMANGVGALSLGLLLFGPGGYDLGEFLGVRPFREGRRDAGDHETFRISWLHRWVRHPWYALSLAILWTRDMRAAWLVSALWITAYILVGLRLEEARLVARFGEAYRAYRTRVPALVPRPWRRLEVEEARRLEELGCVGS